MSRIVIAIIIYHRHKLLDIINLGFKALRAITVKRKINIFRYGMLCIPFGA
jgi:hypothetical protein